MWLWLHLAWRLWSLFMTDNCSDNIHQRRKYKSRLFPGLSVFLVALRVCVCNVHVSVWVCVCVYIICVLISAFFSPFYLKLVFPCMFLLEYLCSCGQFLGDRNEKGLQIRNCLKDVSQQQPSIRHLHKRQHF